MVIKTQIKITARLKNENTFLLIYYLLLYILSNSKEHTPLKANRNQARFEILILWIPKVHYRIHISPSLVPILGQTSPVQSLQCFFFKICINTILSYMLNFQMVSFLQVSPQKFRMHFIVPQYFPHFVTSLCFILSPN